jgi:hypothetical protein
MTQAVLIYKVITIAVSAIQVTSSAAAAVNILVVAVIIIVVVVVVVVSLCAVMYAMNGITYEQCHVVVVMMMLMITTATDTEKYNNVTKRLTYIMQLTMNMMRLKL